MLREFLQKAASVAKRVGVELSSIIIVLGNEAADADSIISSLCLAYIKQQQQVSGNTFYVPVVSIPRSILKLRRETQVLLNLIGLELANLICLEELDIKKLSQDSVLQGIILTDHNLIAGSVESKLQNGASLLVREIIDHHKDAGAYLACKGLARTIAFDNEHNVATVGSCCTLIAELALTTASTLPALYYISVLLQGVICLDTQNMDIRGVGTLRDAAALEGLSVHTAGTVDRDRVFAALRDAKTSPEFWAELNALECLCIDYKQFTQPGGLEVGISSTLLPVQSFLDKADAACHIASFMTRPSLEASMEHSDAVQPLDALIVMSTIYHPLFRRELLIASYDEARLDAFTLFFDASGQAVQLEPLVLHKDGTNRMSIQVSKERLLHIQTFHQRNTKASRKQIAPLVDSFYASFNS